MLGGAGKPVPMEAEIWGRYVDVVERRAGVWRTARRVVVIEVLQAGASTGVPLGATWAKLFWTSLIWWGVTGGFLRRCWRRGTTPVAFPLDFSALANCYVCFAMPRGDYCAAIPSPIGQLTPVPPRPQ